MDRIKEAVMKEIMDGGIAGASVLAMKDQKILYKNSFGYADKDAKKEMRSDTIIRLFSMTKPITSAAVWILLEQKKLAMTDPVSRYLPGFLHPMAEQDGKLVSAEREVTIYDLLNMISGAAYPDDCTIAGKAVAKVYEEQIAGIKAQKGMETVEFCNRLGQCPLAFMPGKEWRYGTSADILGAVVEVVSGMRYGDFLQKEIFDPLGMKDTSFYVPKEKEDRFSEVYDYDWAKHELFCYRGTNLAVFDYSRRPAFESGGAGLVSTIDDYARFACMLLNEGEYEGVRILQKESVRSIRTNQLSQDQRCTYNWDSVKGYGYGNLVRILEDQKVSGRACGIGTFGWDGWTGPVVLIDPVNQVVFLYFIQKVNAGTSPLSMTVNDLVYKML